MQNPFDQFDEGTDANPFDQFDKPASATEKFRQNSIATGNPADIQDYLRSKAEDERVNPLLPYDRINQGLGDPVMAAKQVASHVLPNGIRDAIGLPAPDAVDAQAQQREQSYQAQRAANGQTGTDWWRTGANMFATAPVMAALPGAAPTSLLGAAGGGVLSGATGGLLTPVEDGPGSFGSKKLNQMLLGGATGGLTGVATYGASKMLNPTVSDEVNLLQQKGVTPTMGQLNGGAGKAFEEKLTSVPGLGDAILVGQGRAIKQFNKAAYDTALEPIGEKFDGEVSREGLGRVFQKISNAYRQILPNVTFKADQQFQQDLSAAANAVQFADPATQQHFTDVVKNKIMSRIDANGQMTGEGFKALEEELGKVIPKWQQAGGDKGLLADGVDDVLSAFRSNLERNNPAYADQLRAANTAYGRYADIRRAVAQTRDADGVFTPNGLWSALKAGDKSAGQFVTAQMQGGDLQKLAQAGLKVLGNKYPDSGTTGRAAVAAIPAAIGAISSNPYLAVPAAGAVAASTAYTLSPVQSAISKLFSRRSSQLAPLLGNAATLSAPLLQAGAASGTSGLLGGP